MIITNNLTFDLITIITTILVGVIAYLKWKLTYWNKAGLATLNPSILFGDIKEVILGRLSAGEQISKIYHQFRAKNLKHGGAYFGPRPIYVPTDPEIIKAIMQKDFSHFVNRGEFLDEENDPLTGNLFSLEDAKWKHMRVKLTPTFTSGKMKMMFQTLVDCTNGLKDVMDDAARKRSAVNIKEVLGRFTTDIIGSVAFGIECNSLKNPDAEFRKYGKKVFQDEGLVERMKVILPFILPRKVLKMMGFKLTKNDVEEFFMKAIRDTVEYREKNNVHRKDFMHLLLQLKNRGTVSDDDKITDDGKAEEKALTMNELAAQAFVFFLAGFETSSTAMTFALYELAMNPDVQDKLREEVSRVLEKHGGKLTYEGIMEMTYLDQVINESLRKYPPLPILMRVCSKDYTIPNSTVQLKTGDGVFISTLGIHTDPEYYPNPEKFDPDRFSEENKHSRPPFTWLPFGEGPRVCIGLRFGMLQSKVGLTTFLENYKITINKKTKLPLTFETNSFVPVADGGIWLDVEKIFYNFNSISILIFSEWGKGYQ